MKKLLGFLSIIGIATSATASVVVTGDNNTFDNSLDQQGTSKYLSWYEANPNRTDNITEQVEKNDNVYYSPYIDAGMYEGNDAGNMYEASQIDHLTLAFVQQSNYESGHMDLSIGGFETGTPAFDWWADAELWTMILEPMVKAGNFENIKTAYGGASVSGSFDKIPWDWALNNDPANPIHDKDIAVATLKEGMIGYQQWLTDFTNSHGYSVSMPKSLDFDIEGAAQDRVESLHVLGQTMAEMKKEDSEWNFSLTLPVMPTGLTPTGYNVMNIIVEEYVALGLSYEDLPIINLMLMDYGDAIYQEAIAQGKTNFDLAQEAIENTMNNLAKSILDNYEIEANQDYLFSKIGATPMIGVNDTVWGVFTLEDAKEMYNYANVVGLGYLSMWSANDDRGLDYYSGKPGPKSILSHGLCYLHEFDFAKALNGAWDEGVKNPLKEIEDAK